MDQLQNIAKDVKKIAKKSLRESLSEKLPMSLEDHILDNILGNFNLLDEEVNGALRLEAAEEDKPFLSSVYQSLSQIYRKSKNGFFHVDSDLLPELRSVDVDQLQEILSEFTEREDSQDTSDEVEKGEEEVGKESKRENQLEI